MGRRKKYFTEEEKQHANNEKVKQFYWRNKENLDGKAKAYYWRKKIQDLIDSGKLDDIEKIKQKAIQKGIPAELLIIENDVNKQ